jgi:hypothetical protein
MGFQTGFYRFPVRRSAPPRSSPATAQNAAGVPQNTAGMLLLTAVILLEPHGAGTKYTAIAIHGDEEGANSTRTWASTTIGAKADQLVTLAKKNARVRVGLTTILIIGKSGAPTTGNQHYRGSQPKAFDVLLKNLSSYKRAVDSNPGQALASGQIGERRPCGRERNMRSARGRQTPPPNTLSTILTPAAAGRIS